MSSPWFTARGSQSWHILTPTAPMASAIGWNCLTSTASRLCDSASMPVHAVRFCGNDRVSSGSAMTTRGIIERLTIPAFTGFEVSVMMPLASTSAPVPAVVGMAMIGTLERSACVSRLLG